MVESIRRPFEAKCWPIKLHILSQTITEFLLLVPRATQLNSIWPQTVQPLSIESQASGAKCLAGMCVIVFAVRLSWVFASRAYSCCFRSSCKRCSTGGPRRCSRRSCLYRFVVSTWIASNAGVDNKKHVEVYIRVYTYLVFGLGDGPPSTLPLGPAVSLPTCKRGRTEAIVGDEAPREE